MEFLAFGFNLEELNGIQCPCWRFQMTGARFGLMQEKSDKKVVSGLEISIDGCRIWPLAGKISQNSLNVVSGKLTGACTRCPKLTGAAAPVAPVLTRAL